MKHIYFIIFIIVFLITSCEQATDYYIGIPQQPEFTENGFVPGLNIFGVLRPDSGDHRNNSFVFVQQVYRALDIPDFYIIKDASVVVYEWTAGVKTDSAVFQLYPPDYNFSDTLYRAPQNFNPVVGRRYEIVCNHSDLPEALGYAYFPPPPVINDVEVIQTENKVRFSVLPDSLIGLIDVYISAEESSGFLDRFVPNDTAALQVQLQIPSELTNPELTIYAYDANLTNYYANSNISLNFNKYRTTISTLNSGFGVFGALNYTRIQLH